MQEMNLGEIPETRYGSAAQYGDSFEKIEARIADGQIPVYSKPHFLCIDLDSKEEYVEFDKRLKNFETTIGYKEVFQIPSPSGRGYHVYVLLKKDYGIAERIAMQAALGADPIREMLSIYKFVAGERTSTGDDFRENPTWLFEKDVDILPKWVSEWGIF